MACDVLNIKACSLLKLRSGLTGNYHAICHYSYNLPLKLTAQMAYLVFAKKQPKAEKPKELEFLPTHGKAKRQYFKHFLS